VSEKMLTRKICNYVMNIKERFMPRKGKVYLLLKEERREICKFMDSKKYMI